MFAGIGVVYGQGAWTPKLVKSFGMLPGTFAGTMGANLNGKYVTDSLGTLMVSDGTDSGTYSVKSFYRISCMVVMDGKLFMLACDSLVNKTQLWISDGTTAGTHLVKNVGNATDSSGVLYFGFGDYSLVAYAHNVYFFANDDVHGTELWKSDGTATGTMLVKDINTSAGKGMLDLSNFPLGQMQVANGKLYFCANDSVHGAELWCTDGTAANTHIVTDLIPGSTGADPSFLTAYNTKLCFQATNDSTRGWYITDGTDTGTHLLAQYITTLNSDHAVVNDKLYFLADSLVTPGWHALWVTDGTAAGTSMVRHVYFTFTQYSYESYYSNFLVAYANKLYFGAADNLWVSDGTYAGTMLLKTLATEPDLCCTPTQIQNFGGKLVMRVRDNNGRVDLCVSDGTAAGTKEVAYPASDHTTGSSFVYTNYLRSPMTIVGTKLFFWNTYETIEGHSLYTLDLSDAAIPGLYSDVSVNIYPNPAKDLCSIELPEQQKIIKVELLGIDGRTLKTVTGNGTNAIQLSVFGYSSSVLVAKIYTSVGVFDRKLVVMH